MAARTLEHDCVIAAVIGVSTTDRFIDDLVALDLEMNVDKRYCSTGAVPHVNCARTITTAPI